MAHTTDKPALTISQSAALLTFIRDYADAHAAARVAAVTGNPTEELRTVSASAYLRVVQWLDDVRYVEGAIRP